MQFLSDRQRCISLTLMGACTLAVADFNSMVNDSYGLSKEKVIAVCWRHSKSENENSQGLCRSYLTIPSGCQMTSLLFAR